MSTSAFGIEHTIAKSDSGNYAAGAVLAGGGAVASHKAAGTARKALPVKRGSQLLNAMARHMRGASGDVKRVVALHAATPALGLTAGALGVAALASRRKGTAQAYPS
jgi:hypothetical protein